MRVLCFTYRFSRICDKSHRVGVYPSNAQPQLERGKFLRYRSSHGAVRSSCLLGMVFLYFAFVRATAAAPPPQAGTEQPQVAPTALKSLSLEELSQIEVTTPSKEPVKAFQTAAAIYVITGDDIRRSGATSIPEALRLAPGVEVARIDANKWSIGIRGFGSRLTRSVLVLIDGRTVLHAAVRRYLLGSAGYVDGRHRPNRSDTGAGRHHLGAECGERCDQRHHQELPI